MRYFGIRKTYLAQIASAKLPDYTFEELDTRPFSWLMGKDKRAGPEFP